MTPADASDNHDNVRYIATASKTKPNLKVVDYVRNAESFQKGYTCNWNRNLFENNELLRTQSPIFKIED